MSPFCLHASTSFRSSRRSPLGRINTLANLFWASCSESAGSVMGATTGNAPRQSATLVLQIATMLFTLAHHPALERLERRFGTLQNMRCVLGREI